MNLVKLSNSQAGCHHRVHWKDGRLLYKPDPCSASCSSSSLWTSSTWEATLHRFHRTKYYLYSKKNLSALPWWTIFTLHFSARLRQSPKTPSRTCHRSACGQPAIKTLRSCFTRTSINTMQYHAIQVNMTIWQGNLTKSTFVLFIFS